MGRIKMFLIWYLVGAVMIIGMTPRSFAGLSPSEIIAFPQQPFDHFDDRAFAQIVRPSLEAETKNPDTLAVLAQDHAQAALDLPLVAGQNGVEDGQVQIKTTRFVGEGTHVLGQARSSKGESGHEVIR